MTGKFIYAVACIRAKENNLFTKKDIDYLADCKTYNECVRYLEDKGWGASDNKGEDIEELLSFETRRTWDTIEELTKDLEPFNVFRYANDFHNLKVAIKCVVTNTEPDGLTVSGGMVSASEIFNAVKDRKPEELPEHLRKVADEAYLTLIQTYDGQLCDVIIDRQCLESIYDAGMKSNNDIIKEYAELTVAAADIKTAVRCSKTKKTLDFIKRALAACASIDIEALTAAASKSVEEIETVIEKTPYAEAMRILEHSASEFEKWFDDKLMEKMRTQKWEPFTVGPLVAYIFARQTEIKAVRIILSGKLNHLDDNFIKERLREMYV